MNFKNVANFIEVKRQLLLNSLISSINCEDTIDGNNAVLVLAETSGLSGMIRGNRQFSQGITVYSTTDGLFAAVAVHVNPYDYSEVRRGDSRYWE